MRLSCESEVRCPLLRFSSIYWRFLLSLAAERWRVIALTNNYSKIDASFLGLDIRHSKRYPGVTLDSELRFLGWERSPVPQHIRNLFDDFLDSSEVGMRCVQLTN
jgi:hypothetical protein